MKQICENLQSLATWKVRIYFFMKPYSSSYDLGVWRVWDGIAPLILSYPRIAWCASTERLCGGVGPLVYIRNVCTSNRGPEIGYSHSVFMVFSGPRAKIRAYRPYIKLLHDHFLSHPFFLCSWSSNLGPLVLMMGWDGRRIPNQELWSAGEIVYTFRGLPGRQ
jgi:hypothetical protein